MNKCIRIFMVAIAAIFASVVPESQAKDYLGNVGGIKKNGGAIHKNITRALVAGSLTLAPYAVSAVRHHVVYRFFDTNRYVLDEIGAQLLTYLENSSIYSFRKKTIDIRPLEKIDFSKKKLASQESKECEQKLLDDLRKKLELLNNFESSGEKVMKIAEKFVELQYQEDQKNSSEGWITLYRSVDTFLPQAQKVVVIEYIVACSEAIESLNKLRVYLGYQEMAGYVDLSLALKEKFIGNNYNSELPLFGAMSFLYLLGWIAVTKICQGGWPRLI